MQRRELMSVFAGGLGVGIFGTGLLVWNRDDEPEESVGRDPESLPEEAQPYVGLLHQFHSDIASHVENERLFLTEDGHIVLDYDTTAQSESELETEFAQIARQYIATIEAGAGNDGEQYEPTSIDIISGGVRAILVKPTIVAHIEGNINFEGMMELIHYTDVAGSTEMGAE